MIIGINGKPRTGKTLFMTKLGYENKILSKHEVFSNYVCNFAKPITIQKMLTMPFLEMDRDFKTLLIQEADKIFDRSRPTSDVNRLLRSLTGQSGKRNLELIYDTQYVNKVDTSLTDLTEQLIVTSVYLQMPEKEPICFEYDFCEFDGQKIRKIIKTQRFPAILMRVPIDYYALYDTYAPTMPIWDYDEMKGDITAELAEIEDKKAKVKEKFNAIRERIEKRAEITRISSADNLETETVANYKEEKEKQRLMEDIVY